MLYGDVNLSDGIKAVLGGYGGLYLPPEEAQSYEQIFWKALSEGAYTIEEALDEIFTLLDVPRDERIRLKHEFVVGSHLRRMPCIRAPR